MRLACIPALIVVLVSTAAADLMIVDSDNDRVMLFSSVDGSIIDLDWLTDVGAVGWVFTTPKEARVVGSEIWVSDQVADAIHRFDMDRNFLSSITVHPGDGGLLDNIRGFGTDGSLVYLTVYPSTTTRRGIAVYDTSGAPQAFWPINASIFDAEPFLGNVLISNEGPDNIERYTPGGVFIDNFATGIIFPQQIEILPDDSVITVSTIAAAGIEGVYHFESDGTLRRFIDTEPAKMAFGEMVPRGAYLLENGNYVIAASTGVYTYDPDKDLFEIVIKSPVGAQYIAPLPARKSPCPGDFDGDNDVDQSDLGVLLGDFGCVSPPAPDCPGDIDGDGDTDQSDLGVLLAQFGQPCP